MDDALFYSHHLRLVGEKVPDPWYPGNQTESSSQAPPQCQGCCYLGDNHNTTVQLDLVWLVSAGPGIGDKKDGERWSVWVSLLAST